MSITVQEMIEVYPQIFGEPYPDTVPTILAFIEERIAEAESGYKAAYTALDACAPFPWRRWHTDEDDAIAKLRQTRVSAAAALRSYGLCAQLLRTMEAK